MKRILSVLLVLVMVLSMIPVIASAAETEVVFDFGANSSAAHVDGNDLGASKTYTQDGYTLSLTGMSKVYGPAYDAKGNSCIKLGTSKVVGSFTINVPDDVISIVVSIAKYKTNSTKVNIGGTDYSLTKNSNDGAYDEITVDTSSNKTITVKTVGTTYRAMVNSIKFIVASSGEGEVECAHEDTGVTEAVAATCTTTGFTAGVYCNDCEKYIEGHELVDVLPHTESVTDEKAATCTEDGYTQYTCSVCENVRKDYIDATGHNYVDGMCSVCGLELPDDLSGKYYIAAIRKEGNYWYMTGDVGETEGKPRYQIVDSGVTELPESIEEIVESQLFELVAVDGGYVIKTGEKYLGWSSGNYGTVVDEANAKVVTIEYGIADNSYNIHFAASETEERYLALNSKADYAYYAWYVGMGNQITDLYLVPVSETAEVCQHENTTTTTVEAKCEEAGSTTVTCVDCGITVSVEVIEATGHNYIDGVCSVCGVAEPVEGNGQYMLVTDASSLKAGDKIVIVASGSAFALSTEQRNNNRGAASVTKDGNVVEIDDTVQVLTLETGTADGTFGFNTGSGYLYAASSSSNNLKTQTKLDANASWKITITGAGVATIKAQGTNTRNWLRFNSSNNPKIFSCYASGQTDVSIYKYTLVSGCVHEVADDKWTIVTEATCDTEGFKTGTCSKCGNIVEKEIAALGHSYSFNAEVAMMVCATCGEHFMNSIAEAKAYTDETKTYYMKGIVTYISGKTVYMEDSTGGICVYFNGDEEILNTIALGDELLVMDTLTTYNDLVETTYTKSSEVQILSSGNELPVQKVTITDLLADNSKEYLGERVLIESVTLGAINTSGNTTITDESGNSTIIRYMPAIDGIVAGDVVNLTAVVSIYKGDYQLYVNPGTAAQDVVKRVVAPSVEITHISLNPAKDALGYKAEAQNLPEGAHVEISLWVNENIVVTKATAALRLVNIMACNGGEMTINAKATIVDGEGKVIAESAVEQTTMKETVETVNALTNLTSEQKAAVYDLYEQYSDIMDAWLGENNNIKTWAPVEE